MQRMMLKSKIHGAVLTGKQLDYEGSVTLDRTLLCAADILPGEQVQVLNLNNGRRFLTYAIEAPTASGTVMLNGPAARLGEVGDPVLVLSYGRYEDAEARDAKPLVVRLDRNNQPLSAE